MISLARSLNFGVTPLSRSLFSNVKFLMISYRCVGTLSHTNFQLFSQIKQPSQPKQQYKIKSQKDSVNTVQLIQNYQKQANPSMGKNSLLLLKLLNSYPKQGVKNQDCLKIQQILTSIMQKFVEQLKSMNLQLGQHKSHEFNMMINNYCLISLSYLIKKVSSSPESNARMQALIQDQIIVDALLASFATEDFRFKSYAIKFIMRYHKKNAKVLNRLQKTLQQSGSSHLNLEQVQAQGLIYYLRQLFRFSEECTEQVRVKILPSRDVSSFLNLIYLKIMTLKPRLLPIISQILFKVSKQPRLKQCIDSNVVLTAVEEHLKGIKMLDPSKEFMNDYIHFIQVLQNLSKIQNQLGSSTLSERIKSVTTNIYQSIKHLHKVNITQVKQKNKQQQQPDEEQEDTTDKTSEQSSQLKISMINVNIILGSMLKLATIDAALFEILEIHLFANLQQAHYQNICMYMQERIKIIKAVTDSLRKDSNQSTKARARMIKQEHGRFIIKMLDTLSSNKTLNLINILNLLKLCQGIPTKSRQIKRKLKALMEQQQYASEINNEVKALSQIVMQGF